MTYIYHAVPERMEGDTLIPLNQMRTSHPGLYAQYLQKYKGREELLQRKVPLIGCLWNDVVQFLPLHPSKIFQLQQKLGLIDKIPPYKYFQIELASLDPKKTVVYFKNAPGEENALVKGLQSVDFAQLQEIPSATINYFTSLIDTGELPFNYQFVPHVLYKGAVDISKSSVITL